MNFGGIYKAGFYPYPPQALTLTIQLITAPKGATLRLLDPCAGEGAALAAVAQTLRGYGAKVETYGVELADQRAAAATRVLGNVLQGDWFDTSVSTASMSLLWCNPPYDFDVPEDQAGKGSKTARLEYTFLRASYDRLVPDGLLVYIVPRWVLARKEVARLLAGHFTQPAIYAVPEYAQYKQVVLLAVKRPKALPDGNVEAAILAVGQHMPANLDQATERYELPAIDPQRRFVFYKNTLSPAELRDLAAQHGVLTGRPWADLQPRPAQVDFTPAVPLRRGHIAMLVASGLLGTVPFDDLLTRGQAVKVYREKQKAVDPDTDADAEDDQKIEEETFITKVFTFDRQGVFNAIDSQAGLERFLEDHSAALARLIEDRHHPVYDRPTDAEWHALDGLMPTKRLPGRAEAGLLDAQRHVALAAARAVRRYSYADVVAEPSFGKTPCGLAVATRLQAWPALVICPTHLVEKWAREAPEVVPGATATVIESAAQMAQFVADYQPGQRAVAVLSKEQAKANSGWRPAAVPGTLRVTDEDGCPHTWRVWKCPRCGRVIRNAEEIPLTGELPAKRITCLHCGEPLYQYTRYNGAGKARWPVARYVRQHLRGFFKLLIADECHQYKGKSTDQANAFQDLVGACAGVLTLTATAFGGKSKDLFWLRYRLDPRVRQDFRFHEELLWSATYGRLRRITKKTEADADGFTGARRYYERVNEIPGISPRIVERILPTMIFARLADLGYALPPMTEQIVRLEMTAYQAEQYRWLDHELMTQYQEARHHGDHGLLSVWLQNVLARPNSSFRTEQVVRGVGHGKQRTTQPVYTDCAQYPRFADPAFLTTGAQSHKLALRPVLTAGEWLPKEAWLAAYCQAELAQHRKVLVYLRQTGTRDIQPRLVTALHQAGLRALTIPDSVTARQREAWINAHSSEMDVLLVNPRRVETGLDLIHFATMVFYEIEYSLISFWQAMRRLWRLGQTQPVKIAHVVYHHTMEEAGLALLGQKFKAAALLYGDNAASAISDEAADDGDFLAELAARVLAKEQLTIDGLTGLVSDYRTTAAPWGSPVQVSPVLSAWDAWLAAKGLTRAAVLAQKARRVLLPAEDVQPRLF